MVSIGSLSKMTGVKVPTIRYYEQIGLLPEPDRSEGNQRRYSGQAVERLGFIRHSRDLGFSVEAIRELLELSDHPTWSCQDATRITREQLCAVRARIIKLKRLESELHRIASGCSADAASQCYVLQALADHSLCKSGH